MLTSKRKRPNSGRSAPPGNLNALKHGFYSRSFRTMDIANLDAMLENGLESEISMLRVSTHRLLELSQANNDIVKALSCLPASRHSLRYPNAGLAKAIQGNCSGYPAFHSPRLVEIGG